MLNLSNKAQFFILTAVIIAGFFYTASKYINQYAFIDTSKNAAGGEAFFFNNVKDKAVKTVEISQPADLDVNLAEYRRFAENVARDNGYILIINYRVGVTDVSFDMFLQSQRMSMRSEFVATRPAPSPG